MTLFDAALKVLTTPNAIKKANTSLEYAKMYKDGLITKVGEGALPDTPARPDRPELRLSSEMPKRRKGGSDKGKIALLHAIAHIELNAIDLAWDIMARFADLAEDNGAIGFSLPKIFYDQWVGVAQDEAKHFLLLEGRLNDLGACYGDLPAHGGLWDAALATKDSFAARLAVVPMVLEARGLDVTPNMIASMQRQKDAATVKILQTIHDDEINHVEAGTIWFKKWCIHHDLEAQSHWQDLVRRYFNGYIKAPFNDPSRIKAGIFPDWYEPLAEMQT